MELISNLFQVKSFFFSMIFGISLSVALATNIKCYQRITWMKFLEIVSAGTILVAVFVLVLYLLGTY